MSYMMSSYLGPVLSPKGFRDVVRDTVRALRPLSASFDAVAFRGMSGAFVGPAAAALMGKNPLLVRKQEPGHSKWEVEGWGDVKSYVIIDDLIETGRTVETVVGLVEKGRPGARCAGVALYNTGFSISATVRYFCGPPGPPCR